MNKNKVYSVDPNFDPKTVYTGEMAKIFSALLAWGLYRLPQIEKQYLLDRLES